MTTVTLDPRDVAAALHMDTDDLARVLTKWAAEELPVPEFDRTYSPTTLEVFDRCVGRARNYLVAAHEAMDAWNTDNPRHG